MMSTAQRNAVPDAGGPVVGPMNYVVNIAPAGWYRTSGESASAVSEDHRAADRGGYCVAGATDVQWLAPGTEHHRDDLRVAGDAAGDVGVDRATQGQRSRPDPTLEHGQVHGDHDLRAFPTFGG